MDNRDFVLMELERMRRYIKTEQDPEYEYLLRWIEDIDARLKMEVA